MRLRTRPSRVEDIEASPVEVPGGEVTPKVRLDGVSLRYQSPERETLAMSDVSISIADGEFVSIVGPSGCGKSTTLSMIAGLEHPSSGVVTVNGKPVGAPDGTVGYMLQHDHLFEWRTVLANVLIGPQVMGLDLEPARELAHTLMSRYGLAGFEKHRPSQLSGGMRQRVALIRTLVSQPEVVLLDEPFSALDFQTRLTVSDEVAGILRAENKTAVLVTHDIPEAISMSDRVIVLSGRPGTVRDEYRIEWAGGSMGPLAARDQPEFSTYFDTIWGVLDDRNTD